MTRFDYSSAWQPERYADPVDREKARRIYVYHHMPYLLSPLERIEIESEIKLRLEEAHRRAAESVRQQREMNAEDLESSS